VRAASDRSIRFVFDDVADAYIHGRPGMPFQAVADAIRVAGLESSARVLEVGAGSGLLTRALVDAGLDVLALEPGTTLRPSRRGRGEGADFRGDTFEGFDPGTSYRAIFSANAFHWIDPAVSYAKAARLLEPGGSLVLMWNMPFLGDAALHRRVQREVMAPRGSTFPDNADGVRKLFSQDAAAGRDELAATRLFAGPWWQFYEQRLSYTPQQYVSLLLSMSKVAAQSTEARADLVDALLEVLGPERLAVVDLFYTLVARRR
jgi:SAM-dependent methyltransferase